MNSYQLSRTILRSLSKEWWTWVHEQCSSCERHKQIRSVSTAQQGKRLPALVCAATGTELSGAHAISHCGHRTAFIYCSHSVINTGNSHFPNWLDLEIINSSLLCLHHETKTCNRFSPSLGVFPPFSLFGHSLYQTHSAEHKRRLCLDLLCLCFFIVKPMLGVLKFFP